MSAVPDDVKEGDLVGWKFRAALVVGKVIDVEGDKLTLSPISKPETHVKRSREKVILESELDKEDVKEALREGGHMARRKMHSSSEKAQKMGLTKPHQLMSEEDAHAAKDEREQAYKEEAAERRSSKKRPRGEGGVKGGTKKAKKAEGNESPPPSPSKKKGGGGKKASKSQKKH